MTRLVLVLITSIWLAIPAMAAELPFTVQAVEAETVPQESVYDAVIEAVNQATISAQTSGRVKEINFDVDDTVEKGAVLLRIQDKEQRAALEATEARFKAAEAEFTRIKDLYKDKVVSKAQYDKARAEHRAARAALKTAKEQLEYTVVRAPYAGIVVKRHIEKGEIARPGTPLMTGLSLAALRGVSNIPQSIVGEVRRRGQARVIDEQGNSYAAVKLTISPYADPKSHTFRVRIDLTPGESVFYPGMFAKVAFVTGETHRLTVPASAVVQRSEVTGVYVVSDGRVSLRHIRIGRRVDGKVVVLAGLDAGEMVALDPIRAGVYLKEQLKGGE